MRIVVYGAGGHGKVVADILLARGDDVVGFVDDGVPDGSTVLGLPVLGGAEWLRSASKIGVALGVGSNAGRQRIAAALKHPVITAVHPSAVIARSARIGDGAIVMANAAVNADAVVGAGAIVNTGAVIEHDCVLGDYAHVSPNAALGGAARLGKRSHLGLGAVILPGIAVGDDTVVGAGAVVARALGDGVVAMGVPARVKP